MQSTGNYPVFTSVLVHWIEFLESGALSLGGDQAVYQQADRYLKFGAWFFFMILFIFIFLKSNSLNLCCAVTRFEEFSKCHLVSDRNL